MTGAAKYRVGFRTVKILAGTSVLCASVVLTNQANHQPDS